MKFLKGDKINKVIFLDRDGVICEDTHYITSLNKLNIYNFTPQAINLMKSKGYVVIVISNQSGAYMNIQKKKLTMMHKLLGATIKVLCA